MKSPLLDVPTNPLRVLSHRFKVTDLVTTSLSLLDSLSPPRMLIRSYLFSEFQLFGTPHIQLNSDEPYIIKEPLNRIRFERSTISTRNTHRLGLSSSLFGFVVLRYKTIVDRPKYDTDRHGNLGQISVLSDCTL